MDRSLKNDLASYNPSAENAKAVMSALVKYLNQTIAGPSIESQSGAVNSGVRQAAGQGLARLNKLSLEAAYPVELQKSVLNGWVVKDGVMASIGSGRGVIYTEKNYSRFRLM